MSVFLNESEDGKKVVQNQEDLLKWMTSAERMSEGYIGDNEGPVFLNEAVFVDNAPGVKKAVEILQQFEDPKTGHIDSMKFAKAPKKKREIELALAEEFNASDVILALHPLMTGACAATIPAPKIPAAGKIFRTEAIRKSNGGFKFKNTSRMPIIIIYSVTTLDKLSAREFIGVIMHEIGHNFYMTGILGKLYSTTILIPSLLSAIVYGNMGLIQRVMSKLPFFQKIIEGDVYVMSFLGRFFDELNVGSGPMKVIMTVYTTVMALPVWFARQIRSISRTIIGEGYMNEKFADNFATIYGFGPELASALRKLTTPTLATMNMRPSERIAADSQFSIAMGICSLVAAPFDEHPGLITRIEVNMKALKQSLKDTPDPRVKKIIGANIKRLEQELKEYHKLMGEGKKNGMLTKGIKFSDLIKERLGVSGSTIEDLPEDADPISGNVFL